jgi:hypothetical protein
MKGFILSVNYPLGAGIIKTSGGRKYCFLMRDVSDGYPAEIYPPRSDDDVEFEKEPGTRFGLPGATKLKWISRTESK